jgi:hypothetical protein
MIYSTLLADEPHFDRYPGAAGLDLFPTKHRFPIKYKTPMLLHHANRNCHGILADYSQTFLLIKADRFKLPANGARQCGYITVACGTTDANPCRTIAGTSPLAIRP